MEVKTDINMLIEDLTDDLQEEKCILLIGPEILQFDGKSLVRHAHEQLLQNNREWILYYYEQDSLFFFRNEIAKVAVQRGIRRVYQELTFNDVIYRKILEIPFSLVISLTPDTFLTEAASGDRYSVPHHFDFFNFKSSSRNEPPAPSRERPLIYNLCGKVQKDESLVLDYEDLFRFLQAVLSPDGLSNNIRSKLSQARTFLFLGFDFEKWYSQLLLQLLTGERKGSRKLAVNAEIVQKDARTFLLNQFHLEFLGGDHNFFDQLYLACAKAGMLRPLRQAGHPKSTSKEELKRRVTGELSEVLPEVERMTIGTSSYNHLLLLLGRYNDWQRQHQNGTISADQSGLELNRIRQDLLTLIDRL